MAVFRTKIYYSTGHVCIPSHTMSRLIKYFTIILANLVLKSPSIAEIPGINILKSLTGLYRVLSSRNKQISLAQLYIEAQMLSLGRY